MADIVEEEVELHLVDTSQLVEEAKKLKEAQRIRKEQDELLKKSPKKLKEEKEALEKLKESQKLKLTHSRPSPFITSTFEETLPKGEAKKQTRKGAVSGQRTASAFTAMQKKIKALEKKQKKQIKKLTEFQDKFVDKLDTAKSFLSAGTLEGGALGVFGGIASRFGPIGIAVAAIVATVVPAYFREYERGGIFSTALPITEKEKNIADVGMVVDVRSGTKWLTSDLRIAQKAADTSNTTNLRYEHIRYVSQELGK